MKNLNQNTPMVQLTVKWVFKNGQLIPNRENVPDYAGLQKPTPEEIDRFKKFLTKHSGRV